MGRREIDTRTAREIETERGWSIMYVYQLHSHTHTTCSHTCIHIMLLDVFNDLSQDLANHTNYVVFNCS